MKVIDLNRKFDYLNKQKDRMTYMELLMTSVDSPFHKIFWAKLKGYKNLLDEEGNLIFTAERDGMDSYITDQNMRYTEAQFVNIPFPFKKQKL